jgi:hypothetical protein
MKICKPIPQTSPDAIYEDPILIPPGQDLPYTLTLFDCDGNEPYNLDNHEVFFEIFSNRFKVLTEQPIYVFGTEKWELLQSDPQIEIENRLERIFKWEELEELTPGRDYFYRLRLVDAAGTSFIVAQDDSFKRAGS